LFTIFLFGPCEPLIPMLMYPAARGSAWGVALVTGVFGAATLLTMMMMVALTRGAARRVPFGRFERYGHALAGAAVLLCGVAIQIGL
jgi:sulfite exporter TauE/SafE